MTRQADRNPRETSRESDRDEERNPRKRRVPLGTVRSRLQAEAREGYHRLWVNDYPEGHLQEALDAEYSFVQGNLKIGDHGELGGHDLGSMRSTVVGTKPDGSPMRGYLMEIKQEWHDEDMAERLKHAQDIDNQIRQGTAGDDGAGDGVENRYTPEEGINYHT